MLCDADQFPGLTVDVDLRVAALAAHEANIAAFRLEPGYAILLKDIEEVIGLLALENQQAINIYGSTAGLTVANYTPFLYEGAAVFTSTGDVDGDGANNFLEYVYSQQVLGGTLEAYLEAALDSTIFPPVGEGEGEGEGGEEGEGESPTLVADQDGNFLIDLTELLRIVQFYNSLALHCEVGTEDGYAPGFGSQACAPHSSDYNPQNWSISLSELLRSVQIYNAGGYEPCLEGEDGFCPV